MTDDTPAPDSPAPDAQTGPRLSLLPDGVIALQVQESNPLPGPSVARLVAGPHWALPAFELLPDTLPLVPLQPAVIEALVRHWLPEYIMTQLPFLKPFDDAPEPLQALLADITAQGGIAERAKLTIPELTPEHRAYLRGKGLRLGPVHLYYAAILKPAPLQLRALLWATHTHLSHPLPYPRAGVTSYTWPADIAPDAMIQHWFGYPLYGRRACRVDRIDKIICDVYDSAEKGTFTVKNAWAEWLGCKIDEICTILGELGHTRLTPPPPEGDEEAAKAPIQFRLKSDRPAKPRADRVKTKPKTKPKPEPKIYAIPPAPERKNIEKKERPVPQKKPQTPRRQMGDETPLTSNPFAALKDMIGR